MAFTYKVKENETANSIANAYGFKNYKEAGISKVPSGNFDLIRPGEELVLENYDPNAIKGLPEEGSPVLSSEDVKQSFDENSKKLDEQDANLESGTQNLSGYKKMFGDETEKKETQKDTNNGENTADATLLGKVSDSLYTQLDSLKTQAQADKEAEMSRYNTKLASIDSTTAANINEISSTYDSIIAEQERINKINVDRVKAYGLSGGGRFTPIMFSDAISNRQEEGINKIKQLEGERDSAIALAKAARDDGRSDELADHIDRINEINRSLNDTILDVLEDVREVDSLIKEERKAQEKEHQEKLAEMAGRLQKLSSLFADEYSNMDEKAKDAFIQKKMEETGLDYATVYSIMENAVSTAKTTALDVAEKKADIESKQALTESRRADAAKKWADALKGDDDTEGDLSTSEKKKLEQAGLLNADRQTQLDYLYGDDVQKEEALEKANKTGDQTIKQRTESAGYDYQALKDAGYSDEDIKKALDDEGL
jgi:hypothetical protein